MYEYTCAYKALKKKSTKPPIYYIHLVDYVFETKRSRNRANNVCYETKSYVFVFHFIQFNIFAIIFFYEFVFLFFSFLECPK